jgi:methyl-accepting chemotaxis protein
MRSTAYETAQSSGTVASSSEIASANVNMVAAATETGQSADFVLNAAQEVATISDNLNGSVKQFLAQIRSE